MSTYTISDGRTSRACKLQKCRRQEMLWIKAMFSLVHLSRTRWNASFDWRKYSRSSGRLSDGPLIYKMTRFCCKWQTIVVAIIDIKCTQISIKTVLKFDQWNLSISKWNWQFKYKNFMTPLPRMKFIRDICVATLITWLTFANKAFIIPMFCQLMRIGIGLVNSG